MGGGTCGDEIPELQQELSSFPALQAGCAVQGKLLAGEAVWGKLKLNSIRHSSPELKGQILCLVHALSSYFCL